MANQVKSKQRVADHGEVFTAEREVNAMLDLVKQETERIDSRFLEPACGDGNFLVEILRRKLEVAKRQATPPKREQPIPEEFEKQSVIAVMSVYGVDILQDNVEDCRERLFDIWNAEYSRICKNQIDENCQATVKYILEKNILCGNALSLMKVDNNGTDTENPIVFAEWSFVSDNMVKRRDFWLDRLLKVTQDQMELFMQDEGWETDEETNELIPTPIKEYPLTDYRKVTEHG